VECAHEMEHFDPYQAPANDQPSSPFPLSVSPLLQAGQYIQQAESYRPGSEASLAMDLVLCHYPTACGTMRAFPNRRRQAWLLVMPYPGPVFVPLSGPDMFLDRTSSYRWPHYLPRSLRHRSSAAYLPDRSQRLECVPLYPNFRFRTPWAHIWPICVPSRRRRGSV
jgi:hypothetical protein